jgi:hypothetical protein
MVKILEGERVDVRERRPDVPKELADVCARALARLPDGRRVVSAGADGDVIVWDLRAE